MTLHKTTSPGSFGMIKYTNVNIHRYQLINGTHPPNMGSVCLQLMGVYKQLIRFYAAGHVSSSVAPILVDSEPCAMGNNNCQRICGRRQLNFIKQEIYIKEIFKQLQMPISSVQTQRSGKLRILSDVPMKISTTTARKNVRGAKKN